jgi:hypothetical protein
MAVRLGVVNVDAMLRRLTAKQFREWEHYALLEPFSEERADWRAASVREMIHNMAVESKDRKPMKHFLLPFGEQEKKQKTWQEMAAMARFIALAYSTPAKDV